MKGNLKHKKKRVSTILNSYNQQKTPSNGYARRAYGTQRMVVDLGKTANQLTGKGRIKICLSNPRRSVFARIEPCVESIVKNIIEETGLPLSERTVLRVFSGIYPPLRIAQRKRLTSSLLKKYGKK